MSSTKERWFDQMESQRDSRLAELLGITKDELRQISFEIDTGESNDGLVYGYIVQFSDDNDPTIMAKISDLVSGSYVSLAPWDLDDPEEEELEWEVNHSAQMDIFNSHLSTIPNILQLTADQEVRFGLLVMLHAHIIAVLEQFLSTTFINHVTNSDALTRKLIETDPEFGHRKFSINEIYAQHSNIKSTVATHLKGIIFHDMRKVKPMFADVLGYDFGDIAWLFKAVKVRHDCAHRAGYDKEGNPVSVTTESINALIAQCRNLAGAIDAHVQGL